MRALPDAEQLNYDLFEREYKTRIASYPFKPWLYRFSHRESLPALSETAELISFDSVKDYEDWIERLRRVGTYIDQTHRAARAGHARKPHSAPGDHGPRTGADRQADRRRSPRTVRSTGRCASSRPRSAPPIGSACEGEASAAITEVVIPAYRRLDEFFAKKYLPKLRTTDGIWDTRDGLAYYQNRIQYHTTTNLTAEEIHEIGLKEVARIHARDGGDHRQGRASRARSRSF